MTEPLLALFARDGYARVEPPVLQPADVFLDLSGEEMRRRLFVTEGADGQELCLRPEYTIPVCRQYLAQHDVGAMAAFSYAGAVFRLRSGETGEFAQAGIESIGRTDAEAADAEVLSLAIEAAALMGLTTPSISIGDMDILDRLVDQLGLDASTKRRLTRRIVRGKGLPKFDAAPARAAADASDNYSGLLAAINGKNEKAAHAFVEDVLAIAGISRVGGRTAGEIAERFLRRAARRSGAIGDEARAVLERYLAINGDPDTVALAVRGLATEAKLDLDQVVDAFEARTGFMAARDINVGELVFSASFARNLDYYTGFIFEMTDRRYPGRPVAGGGRYDGLISRLGASRPIPAVGCSLWLERFDGGGP
jgi:ATP phosphoribosyltransferase regulatory subunit